jgi:hypothetical protein
MGVLRIRNPPSRVLDSYFLEHKTLNVRVAKGPGQPLMRAGAKLGHSAPRERRSAAE